MTYISKLVGQITQGQESFKYKNWPIPELGASTGRKLPEAKCHTETRNVLVTGSRELPKKGLFPLPALTGRGWNRETLTFFQTDMIKRVSNIPPCGDEGGSDSHHSHSEFPLTPETAWASYRALPECKAFRELGLLTLPSLYILDVVLDVHQYETRGRGNFRIVQHRMAAFEHLPPQVGVKLINKLPEAINHLSDSKRFKSRLKHLLVSNAFYSVEEFIIESKNKMKKTQFCYTIE
ncbi:hypothetical protein J6590_001205 [Homalodisca vitripennis]|nr:hypothetical protein J6590_001205 [Homalodisca vitripennis]